jgi:signal peptidase II
MNLIKNFNQGKKLIFNKENIYALFFIILIFAFDRFSKIEIINNFNENTYFINDFINFDLIWNTGIGFGLLRSESNLIYNSITILIGIVIIILISICITSENFEKLIFSVIIGGALGNFYDRLLYNAVPDFIDFHYNSYHWFTFNVADVFITLGIIFFLMRGFLNK